MLFKSKSLIRSGILTALLLITFFLIVFCPRLASGGKHIVNHQRPFNNSPVGEITQETVIKQSFPVSEDIVGVGILFANYSNRENSGAVQVIITGNDSNAVYVNCELDASKLIDNADVYFQPYEPISSEEDSSCTINITSNSVSGSAVTIWTSDPDTIPNGSLSINGQEQAADLTIAFSTLENKRFWSTEYLLPLLCILAIGILSYVFPLDFSMANFKNTIRRRLSAFPTLKLPKSFRWWGGFAVAGITLLIMLACVLALPGQAAPFNAYRVAFVSAVVFTGFTVFFWRKTLLANPHILFFIIAISTGLILALFSPIKTGVTWDDEAHFERAVHVSYFGLPEYTNAERTMALNVVSNNFDILYNQEQIRQMDSHYASGAVSSITHRPVATTYGYLAYTPMAMGIFIGRFLDLSFHNIFILGRITNLLFYVLVVYLAIRICPVGKRLMMVIALFPTNIVLAANYSYDPWITALTMLWLAMLLEELANPDRKLTFSKTLLMFGVFVLSVSPKEVYCVLGLLFLLIPKEKLPIEKHKDAFYIAVFLLVFAVACNFVVPFMSDTSSQSDARGGSDVNSAEQLKFILTNPLRYTHILLRFLGRYLSPNNSNAYTTRLSYMGYSSYYSLQLILLTFVTATDHSTALNKRTFNKCSRALVYFTLFAAACLISTSLYLAFTPVGLDTINGVQGRYLLPLLFPCLLFLSDDKIKSTIRSEIYNLSVGIAGAWILFGSIWECCISKYSYL